jgi:hypothetical protein
MSETNMTTIAEERVLKRFLEFHMKPDKMLCFYGLDLEAKAPALNSLVDKECLVREKFAGAFSLTLKGYRHMRQFA